MPNTAKKIIVVALATGGIVAGVATASAAPLTSASPVAATSAEAARLHAEVEALAGKEQALRATLRTRHIARPTTTVAPAGTAVTVAAPSAGTSREAAHPEPTTVPPTVPTTVTGDDHGGPTTTEPTEPRTESDPTTTTSTTQPPTTTTTTWVDDDGNHGHDD